MFIATRQSITQANRKKDFVAQLNSKFIKRYDAFHEKTATNGYLSKQSRTHYSQERYPWFPI